MRFGLQTQDSGLPVPYSSSDVRCRFSAIKIEQNIVTGGTSSTSTPILKFLMNKALLEPASAVRHMAHCPDTEALTRSRATIAIINSGANLEVADALINGPRMQAEAAAL
jgi:hypothetical protein